MSQGSYAADELEKLKTSELKKLCKKEGKSTSGTKSELIARLVESKEEAFTLLQPGEEAKLLGDVDDEENSFNAADSSALENITKPVGVSWSETSLNSQNTSSVEPAKASLQVAGVKRPITMLEPAANEDSKRDDKSNVPVSAPTKIKFNEDSLSSEQEILAKRANRFGLSRPSCGISLTDDKLAARARRFGLPVAESHAETAGKRSDGGTLARSAEDADKLKRRAERFGEITSGQMIKMDDAARKAMRLERFGQNPLSSIRNQVGDTKEDPELRAKLARAEKFGIETDEIKLQKRKARFGLT